MLLTITINGQARTFVEIAEPVQLDKVLTLMDLKADRIAVEHNGVIAARASWPGIVVKSGDKIEIVHFVGGGAALIQRREGLQA